VSVIVFGVTALAGKLGDSTKGAVDARAGVHVATTLDLSKSIPAGNAHVIFLEKG
jgi:hypothetical protein